MNIFNKIAVQGMRNSRTRTFVTIIGVILSAAMITGVATLAVSLQNYLINTKIQKYGDWHVEFLDVDASFVQEQAENGKVKEAAAVENVGYGILEGGENPDKPYVFITGFDEDAFRKLPIHLTSGRLPENSREILVPAHVMTNGGVSISVGDTLTFPVGSRLIGDRKLNQHDPYISGDVGKKGEYFVSQEEKTYTVVGICQRPVFEEYTAPGYTLITKMDETETETDFSVFVTMKKPREVRSYAESIKGEPTYVLNDEVLRFMGFSDDQSFNVLFYSAGGILIALIMLGSVFLIHNSFAISLNDRMRQFGILLSVGATEKQLKSSVLFEGFCIGLIGIPIGMAVSIPCISLVLSVAAGNFENVLTKGVPLNLYISVPALAAAAGISMITILCSAYIPARKAAGTPVMECIRQTNEIKITSEAVSTWKGIESIFGLEGTLALKNFKRNRRRYRSIVMSLTLSIVLVVSAGAFSTYLRQATEEAGALPKDYDIYFYAEGLREDRLLKLFNQMKAAGGVTEGSCQMFSTYSCTVERTQFTDDYRELAETGPEQKTEELTVDIQFVKNQVFSELIKELGLSEEEYAGRNAKLIADAWEMDGDEKISMFVDSSSKLTIVSKTDEAERNEKEIEVMFADISSSDILPEPPVQAAPYVFRVIVPYDRKAQFVPSGASVRSQMTFLSENPSQSVSEMEGMLADAGITSEYILRNIYSIMEQNRNLSFVVNFFAIVFVAMISLIGVVNVFNTISTNIKLRRRELAMLRSIGMPDRAFGRMMRFECALYGFRTLLWGIPAAGAFSWIIYKGFAAGGERGFHFVFPWFSIGVSVLGVFCAIFITMLYAASKIKRENIIDALRDDIT